MSYTSKPFEELDIMDDFLMNAVASNKEVWEVFCRTLISALLQRELGKIRINEKDFVRLPNLFIITITNYDPFGYDHMLYTIHNQCEEIPELEYKDGLTFLYFNTTGTNGGNSTLKALLNYIQKSTINNVTDDVTDKLHKCISKVKVLPEVRLGYMTWEEKIFYERLDAREEGREAGREAGIVIGRKEAYLETAKNLFENDSSYETVRVCIPEELTDKELKDIYNHVKSQKQGK